MQVLAQDAVQEARASRYPRDPEIRGEGHDDQGRAKGLARKRARVRHSQRRQEAACSRRDFLTQVS